jgi:hypothetical protein
MESGLRCIASSTSLPRTSRKKDVHHQPWNLEPKRRSPCTPCTSILTRGPGWGICPPSTFDLGNAFAVRFAPGNKARGIAAGASSGAVRGRWLRGGGVSTAPANDLHEALLGRGSTNERFSCRGASRAVDREGTKRPRPGVAHGRGFGKRTPVYQGRPRTTGPVGWRRSGAANGGVRRACRVRPGERGRTNAQRATTPPGGAALDARDCRAWLTDPSSLRG